MSWHPCKILRRSAPLGPRSEGGGQIDRPPPPPPPPSKNLLSKSPVKIGLTLKRLGGGGGGRNPPQTFCAIIPQREYISPCRLIYFFLWSLAHLLRPNLRYPRILLRSHARPFSGIMHVNPKLASILWFCVHFPMESNFVIKLINTWLFFLLITFISWFWPSYSWKMVCDNFHWRKRYKTKVKKTKEIHKKFQNQ